MGEECSQLMVEPSQLGDPLASYNIMQDLDGKINIPGEDIEEDDDEMEEEDPSPEEQARAWMGLQQVLESLQNPGSQDYTYDNGEEEPIVLLEPQENIYEYTNDIPEQYFDAMIPYETGRLQQQQPLEKREAVSSYNLVLRPREEEEDQTRPDQT